MNIWIMSGKTESCDEYPSIKVWTHEPSSEEIFVELLARKEEFLWELEDGDDEYGCCPFPDETYVYTDENGKRWENLLTYTIEEDFVVSEGDVPPLTEGQIAEFLSLLLMKGVLRKNPTEVTFDSSKLKAFLGGYGLA